METQNTEPSADREGAANDDKSLTAADVQAALKSVFKPNKRNIGLATMLGTALILIQCARAGYLPEFDWSSGAGAVVLVAVLAVSLFAMVALAVLVAIPALPVATEKKSVRKPYLCAIASVLAFLVSMVLLGHLLAALKFTGEWSNSQWFGVIILGLVFGVPALSAYNAARRQPKVTKKGVKTTMLESWWNNFTGLVVLPMVYGVVYLLLARYQNSDAFSVVSFALVPVVPIAAVIALVLFRPRNPLMYQAVGLGLFALFCGPASTGAFSLLGLGDRVVEFYLEKPQYAEDLARGNMRPDPQKGNAYRVFLRLRLGSEIAVSADDKEWGRSADVVAIPRDAIRGLRFVPPSTKQADGTKGVKNSAAGDKAPPPTQ